MEGMRLPPEVLDDLLGDFLQTMFGISADAPDENKAVIARAYNIQAQYSIFFRRTDGDLMQIVMQATLLPIVATMEQADMMRERMAVRLRTVVDDPGLRPASKAEVSEMLRGRYESERLMEEIERKLKEAKASGNFVFEGHPGEVN